VLVNAFILPETNSRTKTFRVIIFIEPPSRQVHQEKMILGALRVLAVQILFLTHDLLRVGM
jgi:hypothetical protein